MGSSTTSTPKSGTYAGALAGESLRGGKLGGNNNYSRATKRNAGLIAGFGVGGKDSGSHNQGGVDSNSLDTLVASDTALAEMEVDIVALEARKNVSSGKTYVVAGADNTSTHDYTATGVVAGSVVVGAFWTADASDGVTAVTGTITPGTDIITVAGGADLSSAKHIVFTVIL